jgi:hypothetical protein
MRDRDGTVIIDAEAATIENAASGVVRYAFTAADTATQGEFVANFRVVYGDGTIETFPNSADINISIRGGGVYAVSVAAVLDGFSTGASAGDVAGFISLIDQADECLEANSVPGAVAKQLKVLGVRHLVSNSTDRGSVTQERSASGASRSYGSRRKGDTGYLETLRTIDQYGCVTNIISRNGSVQLRSVGRRSDYE